MMKKKECMCHYCQADIYLLEDGSITGELVNVGYPQVVVCKSPSACFNRALEEDEPIMTLGREAAEPLLS